MEAIHKLKVECPYEILKIEDIEVKCRPNEHGYLYIKCLIDDSINVKYSIEASTEDKICIYEEIENDEKSIIFNGLIQDIRTTNINGIYYLEIEAATSSFTLDIEEKSRSFQDVEMTYDELIKEILKEYESLRLGYTQCVDKQKKIGKPLFQYKETDYEFLKRIASELGIELICDTMNFSNMFYFGRPLGESYTFEDDINYRVCKDLKKYHKAKTLGLDFNHTDYFYYEIKKYQKLNIGDKINFKQKELYVNQYTASLNKGELIYNYRLCKEKGIWQEKIYNLKMQGISLEGKVLAVKEQRLKIHLDIDEGQNEDKAYWFTFAPPTGNVMYSMPIVGTNAVLYFPNDSKGEPIATACVRKNGGGCEKFSDVNNRYYTTESNNQIALLPGMLSFTCSGNEGLKVSFDDAEGVTLKSDKNINITSPNEVSIKSEENDIKINAKQKLTVQKKGGEGGISLHNEMEYHGGKVNENGTCTETFAPYEEEEPEVSDENAQSEEEGSESDEGAGIGPTALSCALDMIPFVGNVKSGIELLTGKDLITGEQVSRGALLVGMVAGPLGKVCKVGKLASKVGSKLMKVGSKALKAGSKVGKIASKAAKVASKSEKEVSKMLTGLKRVTKRVAKKEGKDVIEETTKEATEKAAKEAVEKGEKEVAQKAEKEVTEAAKKDVKEAGEKETKDVAEEESKGAGKKSEKEAKETREKKANDSAEKERKKAAEKDTKEEKSTTKTDNENKCTDGDPIDTATGSLYIPATDIVLPDIHEEFEIKRKYESTNKSVGLLGKGWTNNFETYLKIADGKINVLCSDGHIETFYPIDDEWINDKGGRKSYSLMREGDYWKFKCFKEKKIYRYNNSGKLIDITDNHNNKLSLTYIGENIETLTTFSNYKLFFTYKDGKVIEIKDELGRTVKYKYDGHYLTDVIHVDQGVTTYTYDNKGYISSIKDQNGNTYTKNFFDKKGRVIRQEYPNGDVLTVDYDDGEKESTFYFRQSKIKKVYRHNKDKLITHLFYEDGTTEEYKYDDYQNKTYIKDRNGFEVHKVFNEFGNLLSESLPNGLKTEYTYDENHNLIKEADNKGKEILCSYDREGNLLEKKTKISVGNWTTESYKYDSYGRILSKIDGNGNTSKYEYSNTWNLESKKGKDPVRVITNGGYVYEYEYDEVGRNTEIKTDYGVIEFSYNNLNYEAKIKDANGNVTIKNYDNMGNLISLYTPNTCFNGGMSEEGYRYTYDHMDRLISIKNPLGIVEKSVRDTQGNIIKDINPNYYNYETHDGPGIEYVYDQNNQKIKTIYPDGGIERFFYDSNGNVIKHISPEYYNEETDDGLGYSYTYDSMNRLSSIINEEGIVEKTFEYDLHGNIIKEIDNEGNSILFKYDLLGNLIEKRVPVEKDIYGNIRYNLTCYYYDKNSNKILEKHGTAVVSEKGICSNYHEIYFKYDEENRLIEVKDKYGAKARYKYDCLNKKTFESFKINDSTTKAIHYIYDKVGNLIQKKEEINGTFVAPETKGRNVWAITNYEYDKNGNITKIITPKGFEIGRVYDKADRLIEQHEKDEVNGIFRSYVYKYDKANNITSISEYSGEEAKLIRSKYISENDYRVHWSERYENRKENKRLFNKLGFKEDKKKKSYVYDAQNRLTHFINFSGNTTRLFYDKNDRIIKQVLPEQYDKGADDGVGTTYAYNIKGQVVEVKNALGETITKNTYDPKGNLKTSIDGENNKVEYTYTMLGQIKDIVTPNSRKENKPAQSYKYDARGNITGITDGNGNETSYILDDWGRIIQITTPEGGVEKYTYDYAGNITSTTDANGGTIEYIYNSLGQVCEIKDQAGNSEYFYYDNEGNLTKHIDRNQNHVDRIYNLDRNIVSVKAYQVDEEAIAIEAKKAEEARTKAIEKAKINNEEGFTTTPLSQKHRRRSFTERQKEKKEKQKTEELEEKNSKIEIIENPNKNKLEVIDQRFNYNPDGTLKSAYTGNMQYEYDYNIEGMLETKSASGRTLLRYTYDKNNNIKTIKDITGKTSIYSYDEVDRVKLIQDDKDATLASYDYYKNDSIKSVTVGNGLKTDYTYDGDGNVQSLVTISSNGEVLIDYNYAYDINGNRLQKVSSKHKNFYSYDSMNRLVDSRYDDRCESFTYDKVGNRLTKTTNDITEKYLYNAKNQLKELHNNYGINYFTYDKQGNTIKEETQNGNNIFEYNTLNQQVKAVTKDGNILVSRYDTEGLRAEIEENEKLTKFIFHKENVLVETDEDYNVVSRFTRGYEVAAADIADSDGDLNSEAGFKLSRHYYTVDEQGSTIFITDKNQEIKNEYWYDAFGNVLESKEQVHNRITYTGQQFDGITGQYYLRARFYNPVIGRFTQEDTYRGDGLNLYAYCGNNPVGYYDPSGYLCSKKINQYNDEAKKMGSGRGKYLREKLNKRTAEGKKGVSNVGEEVRRTTGQNSAELSRNLSREGRPVGDGEAAAHIVASTGEKRQWAKAADSRKILDKYGININDAANGIPLGHPRPHNITHRAGFHEIVNTRLTSVVNNMTSLNYGRKAIRSALRKEIRKIGRETLKQLEELK
ncbi:RHS repeat-associated core domain-containing protein [Clostridium saccharobutylicum]|uniref:tRNA nuclease WapA n=1 Tax=Clostridium saccharobutylicum TaxID=169679 RepID=A0A1S8N5I3_CLOSA|nr:RHS repeat-associated core domain-containing protein [Clostridium saccharobutylicum]OOM11653.1 tRNA nuclease WapA precursor [Clostridium saccharobutylicum]